jgi:VanZ family protein
LKLSPWRATRTARAAFWTAATFSFVMAVLPHPPDVPGHLNDKIKHIIAFATLAALASFAYPRTALARVLAGLSLFGAFIEVVQAIPALHRDSDVKDWVADTVAVAVVLALVWWRRRAVIA